MLTKRMEGVLKAISGYITLQKTIEDDTYIYIRLAGESFLGGSIKKRRRPGETHMMRVGSTSNPQM